MDGLRIPSTSSPKVPSSLTTKEGERKQAGTSGVRNALLSEKAQLAQHQVAIYSVVSSTAEAG